MSRTTRTTRTYLLHIASTLDTTRDGALAGVCHTVGECEVWGADAKRVAKRRHAKARRHAARATVAEELAALAVMEKEDNEEAILEHNRQLDAEWEVLSLQMDQEAEALAAHVEAQDAIWRAENPPMPWRMDQDEERLEWAHAFMARHADAVLDYWTWQQDAEMEHDSMYGKDVFYAEQSDRQAVRRLLELKAPLELEP